MKFKRIQFKFQMSVKFIDEEWSWKTMTLWDYLCEGNYPSKWQDFFLREDIQKDLKEISEKIVDESKDCTLYPPIEKVFRAYMLPLEKIRVIVIGQDPYASPGSAVGICFSIPPGSPTNPSLRNIYNELESEGYTPNQNGSLLPWVAQGCFMINSSLTVEKGNPECHVHIWYNFTEKVLKHISSSTKNVAWLLMGAKALAFKNCIDEKKGHKTFVTSHPSPLSAYKGFRDYPAFVGSGMFRQVNDFLEKSGREKILW